MIYFAYGANMHSPHLQAQVPQAKSVGIGLIQGYELYFHKRGNSDDSGKCNIVYVRDCEKVVYGVLYDIPDADRDTLARNEMLGYGNQEVTIKVLPVPYANTINMDVSDNQPIYAFTYVAHKERIIEHLLPYTWYKEKVVSGAKEHRLPSAYISQLEGQLTMPDPRVKQAERRV